MIIDSIRAALETRLASLPGIVPAIAISSITIGPVALFATATPHGLKTGMPVQILNYTGGDNPLLGLYLVVVLTPLTFNLQNSATKSNIGATIAGNGAVVQAVTTAYENTVYPSVIGVPYQMVFMIPFKPDEPTQGAGYYREHGVFQVTLVYPVGVGVGAINARAELIRNAFKKGSSLINNGINVVIDETPELGNFAGATDSFSRPVKISYRADIYS
jgi:hypothetical protein